MRARTDGLVSVSVIAGEIRPAAHDADGLIGKQVMMGNGLYFHITPTVARQWIGVLEPIAEGKP